ncbi:MAG: aspartate/glutamate racemase family protein [Anaerolineae bacterium]|nr:aspartate/glutamate racemase family protein [Anaerolineae bacterium]
MTQERPLSRVVFLHTVRSVAEQFDALARELLPQVECWHIIDEMLAKLTLAAGCAPPLALRRMVEHATAAADVGAAALQVTCSSISPAVPLIRPLCEAPVYGVDDAMVARALRLGRRIGIAATARPALDSLAALIAQAAASEGQPVEVEKLFCDGAYGFLLSGELTEHDRIVRGHLARLAARCDVVVAAQASMARAAEAAARELPMPVLSSPRPAVERLRELLASP